jgi:hypothetical protein
MEKLSENIKEFTYDAVGYMLPGIIVIYLALISIINNMETPIYIMFTNIKEYKLAVEYMLNLNLVFILSSSYIAGHLINFIADFIDLIIKNKPRNSIITDIREQKLYKFSKKIIINSKKERREYVQVLKEVVLSEYKEDKILKLIDSKDEKVSYLQTKASTNSRFEGHNDLIQKYIYKSKLYGSLSSLFLILFIDSIISIIRVFIYTRIIEISYIVMIVTLLILLLGFYDEHKRHIDLKQKECYIYLIEKLNKNYKKV